MRPTAPSPIGPRRTANSAASSRFRASATAPSSTRSIAAFDRARLQDGPRAQNRDPAPVFIVGMPRSGTTLAEQIIAAHPQGFGAGERGALNQAFGALGGATTGRCGADRCARRSRLSMPPRSVISPNCTRSRPDKARIVDKMPGNFNFLGLAALMLPGARIIHCVRDPRDIGLSIFSFRFYGYHPYAHDLGDLGWYIAQHDRLMAHWREALPNPILTLRAERLGRGFRRHAAPRPRSSRAALRPRLRALLRKDSRGCGRSADRRSGNPSTRAGSDAGDATPRNYSH